MVRRMKAYQKKMVFIKNTGSALFEAAYFVLSEKALSENIKRSTMTDEAKKIIKENFKKKKKIKMSTILSFFTGAALSLIVCLLIFL